MRPINRTPHLMMSYALLVGCSLLSACAVSSAQAGKSRPEPPPGGDIVSVSTSNVATTTTLPKTTLTRTLEKGISGEDVRIVQQRLKDLHFDVGAVDGQFGSNTEMAIWAYQALILNLRGKDRTGKITPELWQRIQDPLGLPNKRPNAATHVEILLAAQAMVVYVQNELRLITHISTGSGEHWCAEPRNVPAWPGATTTSLPPGQKMGRVCGESVTPGGIFKIYMKRPGWVDIPLGRVYNMLSFNSGIAIHGFQDVPSKPASHGCVRVPMHIAEYLPDWLKVGDQVFVWDGVKEPEVYGAQKPPGDQPDPNDTLPKAAPGGEVPVPGGAGTTPATTAFSIDKLPDAIPVAPATTKPPVTTLAPTTLPVATTVPTTVPPAKPVVPVAVLPGPPSST
jgi:hypothetical protein